jgi:hypothetical protein
MSVPREAGHLRRNACRFNVLARLGATSRVNSVNPLALAAQRVPVADLLGHGAGELQGGAGLDASRQLEPGDRDPVRGGQVSRGVRYETPASHQRLQNIGVGVG